MTWERRLEDEMWRRQGERWTGNGASGGFGTSEGGWWGEGLTEAWASGRGPPPTMACELFSQKHEMLFTSRVWCTRAVSLPHAPNPPFPNPKLGVV